MNRPARASGYSLLEPIKQDDYQSLLSDLTDVKKMLTGLINRLDGKKSELEAGANSK